jgi:hypothetical protein
MRAAAVACAPVGRRTREPPGHPRPPQPLPGTRDLDLNPDLDLDLDLNLDLNQSPSDQAAQPFSGTLPLVLGVSAA